MKSISSLSSSFDGALQALPVDSRTDYLFNLWKDIELKNREGLLSDDEMQNQMQRDIYDTIAGLKNPDARDCISGMTERFSLMFFGFYLKERVSHLEAVYALVKASEIILFDEEAPADEYLQRSDECKQREEALMQEIDGILALDIWSKIEKKTGIMRPSIEYDWNKSIN